MNFDQFNGKIKNKVWHALNLDSRLQHWDDERFLKLLYRVRMGRHLNLTTPTFFSEKLQWLKLYDRNVEYTTMVDKYAAKQWVSERIGQAHIVPNLGVWSSFDEIDFEALPEQFVLKCTHDSGGLWICDDKSTFDPIAAREKIENSLQRNYFSHGREWPYKDVEPRILAEVFLPSWIPVSTQGEFHRNAADTEINAHGLSHGLLEAGVIDYKFYCFNGEPLFLYVSQGLHDHSSARMDFLTCDWKPAGFHRTDFLRFDSLPKRPKRLLDMLQIARILSERIPFVRVDLFEHHDEVIFSELTFTPSGGMMRLTPSAADQEIGDLLDLTALGDPVDSDDFSLSESDDS